MESDVNYTLVGGFVIILLTAIIISIVWLSSGFSFDTDKIYLINMQESVSGLNIDSPVEYNGVEVGSIKKIDLNNKNPQLVELLIKIKSNIPITKGTIATLNTRGVTGITFIALKDKGRDLTPLKPLHGQLYPVIKTAPSIFVRLDTALSRVSDNLQKVTAAIQAVLDKENQLYIKRMLQHVERITGTLDRNSQKLNTILQNTAIASQNLTPLLQSSLNTMKTFESQTLPITYQVLNRLDEMTANLSQISLEIKDNPSILIRGSAPGTLGPGEK
jgi:phospholipid/cholesterol/gamma-HCH transport system substrate-binding protein